VRIIENVASKRFDPQLRDIELPLTGTYHPAGFRVDIATNSRHVLEAAEESWGACRLEFDCEPLEFRVVTAPGRELAPPPVFRMQRHLLSVVSDAGNHAIVDPHSWFAAAWVSENTAADHAWFRWFFLESVAYLLLAQRYVVPVHAACVARRGAGVLMCGKSGAGKSTLSFACARAGWTYLGDDSTCLLAESNERLAIGRPHHARFRDDGPALFPELGGLSTSVRPNGKLSLEVPMAAFPEIRIASRCRIESLVLLDRQSGGRPRRERVLGGEAVDYMLGELPTYGSEVDAMHERTLRRLQSLSAWRICYESLDQGLRLLQEILPA